MAQDHYQETVDTIKRAFEVAVPSDSRAQLVLLACIAHALLAIVDKLELVNENLANE